MLLCNFPDDGKAESTTLHIAAEDAVKTFKYMFTFSDGNAGAIVFYFDDGQRLLLIHADFDCNAVFCRGIADRIVDQIAQHFPQHQWISENGDGKIGLFKTQINFFCE